MTQQMSIKSRNYTKEASGSFRVENYEDSMKIWRDSAAGVRWRRDSKWTWRWRSTESPSEDHRGERVKTRVEPPETVEQRQVCKHVCKESRRRKEQRGHPRRPRPKRPWRRRQTLIYTLRTLKGVHMRNVSVRFLKDPENNLGNKSLRKATSHKLWSFQ